MILRKADIEDAASILEWRNDESTRAASFSKDVIQWEDHIKWYEKKLSDENCLMFIAEDEGRSVGSLRIDINGNVGEISYMVAPAMRGKGYGTGILELSEKELPDCISALVGLVRKENQPSLKCFENNGYVKLNADTSVCFIKVFGNNRG